jgi:CDP-4-dehydro-6-deoxyglucose reductase, E1
MNKIWYAPNKFESYGQEEIDAVTNCLKDGLLAGFGPKTIEFEKRVSEIFGKKYGLFVNSGSSACLLAIASLGLPDGSEIITPACTFATTVAPIVQLGCKPVFCDVGSNTYVPSVDQVLACVTENTVAVMLPNLIGNTPDWKTLREKLPNNVILIEDSADTITYTPWSDISTTSFYASHIITAGGSGGMVMFNDEKCLKRATMFRDWGRIGDNSEDMKDRFNHVVDGIPYDYKFLYGCLGYNFKSSEMNAAFGLVQLDKFDKFKDIRRANVERYLENLKDTDIVLPDDSMSPNWLAIPLQYNNRMNLLNFLESRNIQTRVTFSGNITRHPAFREFFAEFTNSDIIMKDGFLLGCHHGMTTEDVDFICDKIIEFLNRKRSKAIVGI